MILDGAVGVRSDRCLLHTKLFKAICLLALSSFLLPGMMPGGRSGTATLDIEVETVIRRAESPYPSGLAHLPSESYKEEKQSSILLDTMYIRASVLPDYTKLKCQGPG